MNILEIRILKFPEIKIIRFGRFGDHRGYFTEHFRESDLLRHPALAFPEETRFVQCNESFSRSGTVRGLHFQWNPFQGKLVRTLQGRMVDLILDIRTGSPNFGKIIAYDMPTGPRDALGEWIWVPPGFAHGNFFTMDTMIEYFCTGEYSPAHEAGISPLAGDIDWSLCDPDLKRLFDSIVPSTSFISEKDKRGFSVADWKNDKRSENFLFSKP